MMKSQQKIKIVSSKENFNKIIPIVRKISDEYDLCDYCTGRLFTKKLGLSSNKLLGKKIREFLEKKLPKNCYICKNILSNLDTYLEKMLEISYGYDFSTFVVGAMLRPSVTDRDDVIRSKFKLRGIDSVKTDITQQLGKKFAKKNKTTVEHISPDLTFTINFKKDSCELKARSLLVFARYNKTVRGFPQKQTPCNNCNGIGCVSCNFHGISNFNSVEGKISKILYDKFGCTKTKFTWIGGEDKSSLVLGKGRPFFVKLQNPKKRKVRLVKKYHYDGIMIHDLKILDQIPKQIPKFRSKVKLSVVAQKTINPKNLKLLKGLTKIPILVLEKTNKGNKKSIYEIKYKKSSTNSFLLWMTIQGGISIKRFIEGNNIKPNLTEILENKCICKQFDFNEIDLLK